MLDSLRTDVHGGPRWTPPAGVDLHVADVRDRSALDGALAGVEAVLHLAAKVGLGVDVGDLPDYASSNDAGTAELLAGMARAGVKRLTLASSMVVYGEGIGHCAQHGAVTPGPRIEAALAAGQFEPPCPHCGEPLQTALVAESAPLDPRNAYASSKVAQEFYAANWARVTGGSVAALRYHNVYGPGMPRDTPYAGVAAIFTSALRRGEAPKVFEDGRQRRDFVHVRDVAAATVMACEKHVSGVRAFNVGSGTPRTVGDMARRWRGAERAAGRDRTLPARRCPPHHGGFLAAAETLLRLDHFDVGRPVERRAGRGSPGPARTPNGAEPIFQARRRDEPQQAHLLRAGVRDLVLQAAADQDHGLRPDVVELAFDVGLPGAAIAEQQLVAALMGMTPDMRAGLEHLQAG